MSTKKNDGSLTRSDRWWGLTPLLLVPFLVWGGEKAETTVASVPVTIEALGTELPLHVNARVERWMERFQGPKKAAFETLLDRRGVWGPLVRRKLRERGMPEELLYLAMMESGLKPRAVSSVSAIGLWQFMSPTAIQYGLRLNEYVDERRDPVRATDAALDYLQWLHERFDGSWYLAAAAYNAGPGRVQRVLRRHAEGRSGEEDIYWEVLDHLPHETREYVPRLIAATILGEDPSEYGFVVTSAETYRYETVFVPGGTSLWKVADVLGVQMWELRNLNPHLLQAITPPGQIYGVRVPVGGSSLVVASIARETAVRRADD